ncbi:MAG: hypothetical protein R3300_10500 [Candidatus Promineifilaceae bacterium]|nr:hypothetical protein [Candidatus Promineifilaceae bacterium]
MSESEISKLQGRRTVNINEPRTTQTTDIELAQQKHREALRRIRDGLATKVRILASHDSCPVCKAVEGAYEFDEVPQLPLEGCSHPSGCRCHYAPILDRYGP